MSLTHEVGLHGAACGTAQGVSPRRVLVADEDDEARERVLAALIEDGHEVVGLRSGVELVEYLDFVARDSLRAPDLIATGAGLPRRSALQLLETLRGDGWTMPVVLLTWSGSSNVQSRVEMAGPAALVTKPFDVAEVRQAMLMLDALAMATSSAVPVTVGM
jgi:DNA-binding response OmpR family regulator